MKPNEKLISTKVFVRSKEEAIKVINKAKQLGFRTYADESKTLEHNFFAFYPDGDITYVESVKDWLNKPFKEVTVKEILKIEPIHDFEIFQRVLVRDSDTDKWIPKFFSHFKEDRTYKYITLANTFYKYCIPFEGNEHLAFTTKSPEDE